ncbi:MAG: molybdopterin molybdotransferase MoeA [Pseudomonadota bacterium]
MSTAPKAPFKSLIGIDDAQRLIAERVAPVQGTERCSLQAAQGRVLAEPITAHSFAPPCDMSAMDGYAVDTAALSGAGPWRLRVSARIAAGQAGAAPAVAVTGGTAARIFTGAPVPAGADAVLAQECVRVIGEDIVVETPPSPGQNIRPRGGDMVPGQHLVPAGQRVGMREIAAAAGSGQATLPVRRAVRVALIITGNEVFEAGSARPQGCIWDVNTPVLESLLTALGPVVERVSLQHSQDDRGGIAARLSQAAESADLIVTTGGLSVGDEDHVIPSLEALGAEIFFRGVAMKPGKPVSCGRVGGAVWLGLPGNPLAAITTWQLFGTALCRALSGDATVAPCAWPVVLREGLTRKAGRAECRLASLGPSDAFGRRMVSVETTVRSGNVAGLPQADGFVLIPADAAALDAGALVSFYPFAQIAGC